MSVQVSIAHPGGAPMKHSEALVAYLVSRKHRACRTGFTVGEWLKRVDDASLAEIIRLGECVLEGPSASLHPYAGDDFVQLCAIGLAAEHGMRRVVIDVEVLTALQLITSLESFSRQGLLVIKGRLALDPLAPSPMLIITERGIATGLALSAVAPRGSH